MKRLLFLFTIFCTACTHSHLDAGATCAHTVSYHQEVLPVLIANCTQSGCHDGNEMPSLSDFSIVSASKAQIREAVASGAMPRNGVLSPADKQAILCWIDQGAPAN